MPRPAADLIIPEPYCVKCSNWAICKREKLACDAFYDYVDKGIVREPTEAPSKDRYASFWFLEYPEPKKDKDKQISLEMF